MSTDNRPQFGFLNVVPTILAVVLWQTTMWLLGYPDAMPPEIKAKIGSVVVLTGCFLITRPLVGLTALLFRPKSAPSAPPRPAPEVPAPQSPRSALFRRSGARPESFPR